MYRPERNDSPDRHYSPDSPSPTRRGLGFAVSSSAAYLPQERSVSPAFSFDDPHPLERMPAYSPPSSSSHPLPPPPPPQHAEMLGRDPHADIAPPALPTPPAHARSGSGVPALSDQDTAYHGYAEEHPYAENPFSTPHASYPPSAASRGHHNPFASTSTIGTTNGAAFARMDNSSGRYLDSERPGLVRPLSTDYSNYPHDTRSSHHPDDHLGVIDLMEVEDDDEDPWAPPQRAKRGFFGKSAAAGAGAGAAGAAAGAGFGMATRDASGNYNAIPGGAGMPESEKSAWLAKETAGKKRLKIMAFGSIALIIILAIAGGVVGAVLSSKGKSDGSNAADDNNGQPLTKDSSQIKALMNNPDLHKVFPGIDYTPLNSQYPGCLSNPPSQNNITKDIAVLSQLTPEIRLYGTDCNQTAMVYQAIDTLGLKSDMRVWLGVWQDGNSTTNKRQLDELYKTLDMPGIKDVAAGIFVGNEVLFSKYMSKSELLDVISDVRTQVKQKGYDIPIGTSDLGSNWDATYAEGVDFVGANIHPFFGGVPADQSASWTWSFWQNNDVSITGNAKRQIISEVGWPSAGGNDCGMDSTGTAIKCDSDKAGAVAGIDEMNRFMSDWVCQALANGTQYFWFEAFDEPWKVQYNKPGEEWEDRWGLLDVNRVLKNGVSIPNCDGKQAGFSQ